MWADESYTMQMLHRNVMDMLKVTAVDVHPPLYYIIAKFFTFIFGYSVASITLASITPLVLTMFFILYKTKQILPKRHQTTSLITILLIGLAPVAFTMGLEMRMYTWAMFFVTCSGVYAFQIFHDCLNKKYITLFILTSVGAAYTHYYAAVSEGFIYIILFLFLIIKNKRNWKLCLMISAITVVGYLPWLPIFLKQFNTTSSSWWLTTFNADSILGFITFFFTGNFSAFFLVSTGIIIVGGTTLLLKTKDRELFFALSAISVLILTVLSGCILSKLIRPLFISRYMYPASGLFFLGVSICASKIKYNDIANCVLVTLIILNLPYSYNKAYIAAYKTGTESFKQFAEQNNIKNEKITTDIGHLPGSILPYYLQISSDDIGRAISKNTRGYVITEKKLSIVQEKIPNAKIKQAYTGNIDNKYYFTIFYVQDQ